MVLGRLRRDAARYLMDTCTIERQDVTVDEFGSARRVLTLVAADVPCRVITAGAANAGAAGVVGGQDVMSELYRVALLPDQAIDVDHQVTIGADVYQVVRLETALTGAFFRHAVISRKRGG